jgi:CRP/FNR family transcriptional regulator, cyclic AMP receptor protein
MESLSKIPLFKAVEPSKSERCARSCIWKDYDANELVIDVDDESNDVRFIISGRVRIILRIAVGKEVILGEMGEGDFFGEIAAIDGATRSANVTALTRSRICIMPQRIFLEILRTEPDISMHVLKMFAARVRALNLRLGEHSFLQAKHRLYAELLRLSRPRSGNAAQRSISPPPIQRELAERIGSRREVVSRELNHLEREGHVQKARGALVLVNVNELQRRISEALEE